VGRGYITTSFTFAILCSSARWDLQQCALHFLSSSLRTTDPEVYVHLR
jgi:hypothetical protein